MGFLTTMTLRRPFCTTLLLLLSLTLLLGGCAGLRLSRVPVPRPSDWRTFGRTPQRTSTTEDRIDTPLSLAWEYDLTAATANGAPVVTDSIVIAGTMRGELHAIRLADGRKLGWVGLGDAIHGTPVVNESVIIVPLANSKESVVAFDLMEGRLRWKQTCGDVETSLLLKDARVFGGTTGGSFFCLDASTGAIQWLFNLPDNTRRKGIRSSPVAWRSIVVFGADDGWLYALDAATGTVKWKHREDAPIVAPPVADSTLLVVGTTGGKVLALDPATGDVRWRMDVGGPVYGHSLLATPLVVVVTTNGVVSGLSALTGEQQWTTEAGGPILAGPSAAGNTLFIGTLRRELLALSLADGKVLWKGTTEGRIKTSPVISCGLVIVTTDDRSMIAYRGASKP
jgi:outer membrane protein assembly factor BamB